MPSVTQVSAHHVNDVKSLNAFDVEDCEGQKGVEDAQERVDNLETHPFQQESPNEPAEPAHNRSQGPHRHQEPFVLNYIFDISFVVVGHHQSEIGSQDDDNENFPKYRLLWTVSGSWAFVCDDLGFLSVHL